jgi:hypothetical protein
VRAVTMQPLQMTAFTDGTKPTVPTVSTIGSAKALEVALSHAVAAYGFTRSVTVGGANCVLFDGVNDECAISGSGAGQITFEVPSGLTGTVVYEARVGTGTYFATPVVFHTGGPSTFPARGQFLDTGFSDYRLRVTVASSGSTSPTVVVSPGTNPVTAGNPCYVAAAASTNSTLCKSTSGFLRHVRAINTTATLYYLRLYDLGAAPTCSSATGYIESVPIPASAAGSGLTEPLAVGQRFGTGVGFCITGGAGSTDNTNAAVGVFVRLLIQ